MSDDRKSAYLAEMGLGFGGAHRHAVLTNVTEAPSVAELTRDYVRGLIEVDEFDRLLGPALEREA